MAEPVLARPRQEHDYPMVGEAIGMWRLVRGLGRGGMGEVYEAEYDYIHLLTLRYGEEQRELIRQELDALPRPEQARLVSQVVGSPLPHDARFAIKICNARSGTPGYRRFLQEAEVARRLGDHPYIVTVHQVSGALDAAGEVAKKLVALDQGKNRDLAYMVMDLASCAIDPTRLTIGEAVHVVRCIATALDHAHTQGVVHRDLKPENILGAVEHPLLTDFGIAKEIDQSEGLTRTGQIIGTLDYMSPEQATDAKRVDHRSDIYSLGVVLFEFATQGQLPYSHKLDRDSCLAAIRSNRIEPKWPREHVPRFPARLERIILKAMAHRQEDRYQGMSELIGDLDRFTRGEPMGWWGRVKPRALVRFHVRRHPRLVWGAVAALALVLIGFAALWVPRMLDPHRRLYEEQLAGIEAQVAEVVSRRRFQLDRDKAAQLEELRLALSDGQYPEHHARLVGAEDRLLRHGRLELYFSTGLSRPERSLTPEQALAQLKVAARSDNLPSHLDASGLVIADAQQITLPRFGRGTVYLYAVLNLPQLPSYESFQVRAYEDEDAGGSRHLSRWSIREGRLAFELQEDEKPPLLLGEVVPQSRRIFIAMELGPDRVRAWLNGPPTSVAVRGLRDGATATISMDLPKDTVIEKLIVAPSGPK